MCFSAAEDSTLSIGIIGTLSLVVSIPPPLPLSKFTDDFVMLSSLAGWATHGWVARIFQPRQ